MTRSRGHSSGARCEGTRFNWAIRIHVMSADHIHADDTTAPVLAKLETVTGGVGRMRTRRPASICRDERRFNKKTARRRPV